MRRTLSCGLVLVGLLAAVPGVHSGKKPAADEPTVVIRVKSLDTVLQNLKLLSTLLGREKAAEDIQGLIKAKVGSKGLQGIDLDRPLGAYVRFGKELDDLNGALLIPVSDQAAFVTLLDNLGMRPSKGKDGIYTLQTQQNIELYLRFANKYAYVSAVNTENLSDKNLLDPAKVLAGTADSVLSATVRLDQIPDVAKLLALGQLEQKLQDLQDDAPKDESAAQKVFRKAVIRQVSKTAADVLKEGERGRLDVTVNDAKKELTVRLSLAAQKGTELARTFKAVGQERSPFAGLMTKGAAFRGSVDVVFPEPIHKAFAAAIEEAAQKGLAEIDNPAKRKQAKELVDALLPTARSGQLDAFFGMAGPVNNHYTLLAALKVKDGDRLGTVVHDLVSAEVKTMPADAQKRIQLDADSAGSVKVHRFELPPDPKTGKVLDELPGDPNLYVAFRKDALFLAIGPSALATLKEAVASQQSGTAPVFLFDFNVARMSPTIAKTAEQKELARKLFPAGKEGSIRTVVEGGDSLNVQVNLTLDVLEFFAKMNEGKGAKR
jgi:hypothetical protein